MATVEIPRDARTSIRWGRVIGLALALEAVLFVTLLPLQPLLSLHVWFAAVAAGCIVFGYACGWLVARGLSSRGMLHGLLVGVIATASYIAINMLQPGGVAAAVTFYGAPLFAAVNLLRIAGCVLGASIASRAVRQKTADIG